MLQDLLPSSEKGGVLGGSPPAEVGEVAVSEGGDLIRIGSML